MEDNEDHPKEPMKQIASEDVGRESRCIYGVRYEVIISTQRASE